MALYRGRKVTLNKPQRGGSKKFFCVCESWQQGVKVSFGDPK